MCLRCIFVIGIYYNAKFEPFLPVALLLLEQVANSSAVAIRTSN